jgi:hypothetical protein
VFSIIDLAEWATRINKYEFERGITRTNEAAELIILSPNSAQNSPWFPNASLIRSRKYMN